MAIVGACLVAFAVPLFAMLVLAALNLFSGVYLVLKLRFGRADFAFIIVWLVCTGAALAQGMLPVKFPDPLFDGPYVYKQKADFVRVQALVGNAPADNIIPLFATEYLIRGVSFVEERPIAPGQELSNRPILMALAVLPMRLMLGEVLPTPRPLPRIDYVGKSWPDATSLVSDFNFRIFLGSATALNALVCTSLFSLLLLLGARRPALLAVLLSVSSLYVMQQAFFTWPKSLAAFFVITSWIVLLRMRSTLLAGLLLAAAYWSHPFALAFGLAMMAFLFFEGAKAHVDPFPLSRGLGLALQELPSKSVQLGQLAGVLIVSVLIWKGWSEGVLGLGGNLISQNLSSNASLIQHVWFRLSSLWALLVPQELFAAYPDAAAVSRSWIVTLANPMGLLFWFLFVTSYLTFPLALKRMIAWAALVPGVALVLPFSYPSVPLLHGWQAAWPVLLAATAVTIQTRLGPTKFSALLGVQFAIGVFLIVGHLRTVGALSPLGIDP
jgi:hypothetical protein